MSTVVIATPSSSSSPSFLPSGTVLSSLRCLGCKKRKKGCDKKLPSCTACARSSVVCHYEAPATANGAVIARCPEPVLVSPGATALSSGSLVAEREVLESVPPSNGAFPLLGHLLSASSVLSSTVDGNFHLRVCGIIEACGKYTDDITVAYFKGVHRWLPIISRSHFHDCLVRSQNSNRPDLSILLLSMCLITHKPEENGSDNNLQSLYVTTKMLFAHAQTIIPTSTSMAQAGLLIATYEYAHGLTEAAYISIATCARMGQAIGLHRRQFGRSSPHSVSWPTLKDKEEHNLWWGILIGERHIMSEACISDQSGATQFPDMDDYLPVDSDLLDQRIRIDAGSSPRYLVSALDSQNIGSFGREAQAAYLYDSVQQAMCVKEPSLALTQLKLLDFNLQKLFGYITCQSGTTWGLHCGSIYFLLAAFFDLHEFVLRNSELYQELYETSRIAVEATVRMIVDVARSFNQRAPVIDLDALPPRCSHLARAALDLREISDSVTHQKSKTGVIEIRKMLTCLNRRWRMAGKQLKRIDMDQYPVQILPRQQPASSEAG